MGIRGTCFFTNSPSASQVDFLHTLLPKFKYRVLLLDRDATVITLQQISNLATLGITIKQLPPGLKDPAEIRSLEDLQVILGLDSSKRGK